MGFIKSILFISVGRLFLLSYDPLITNAIAMTVKILKKNTGPHPVPY